MLKLALHRWALLLLCALSPAAHAADKLPNVMILATMRQSTAMSADGMLNLYGAVVVAGDKASRGKGTLLVMNDEIHSGREATKRINVKTNAFYSQWGLLGMVVEGKTYWFRNTVKTHTNASEFDIANIDTLPMVQIVYATGQMYPEMYDGAMKLGAKTIIHAGTGNGSVANYMVDAMRTMRSKGVQIIRSARVPDGFVIRNGEQ